jgi:DNA-binding IclR family transcriptional regulator
VNEPERRQQGVQSIELGARVLAGLAAGSAPASLGEVARAAGMPASKVHRYLVSLAKCGLARQDPTTGHYDLGETALHLGLVALSRLNVVQRATQAMIDLNQRRDVTVLLSVWSERGPVVVGWHDASEVIICNVHVGSVFPLLRTATGRVFLAYLPKATTQRMVAHELKGIMARVPDSRLRSQANVDELIAEVRRERLGVTREEFLPGLSAVAAPVFDHQGRIAAAIAILGLRGTVDALGPGTDAEDLRATANAVSRELGFKV